MSDPFCACPGLGYSPAAMVGGWLRSLGSAPEFSHAPDRQVLLTHQGRTAVGVLCTLFNLGPGDEVLLPAYNCGAEVDPFVHAGCRVIFYRIDRAAQADVADILRRLTPATKLVYITHFFGWPQDIAGLPDVCRQRNVLLVEDCAQTLFSEEAGNPIGTLGDAVIYSFVKSLALPDGGALVLKPSLGAKFKALRSPRARYTFKASLPLFKKWFMQDYGFWQKHAWGRRLLNRSWKATPGAKSQSGRKEMLSSNCFRESQGDWGMSRVSRGLLKQAHGAGVVAHRRRNDVFLHERLNNREQLQPLHDNLPGDVCPLAYPVYAKDPGHARAYFDRQGILVQGWPGYYPGMPWDDYPETCALKDNLLTLPVHQDLSLEQMEYIARCANNLESSHRRCEETPGVSPDQNMLIITADDYGENVQATDRILDCFRDGSLTSAAAMVFMADSVRAATLARETNLEIGLHLNLSEAFTGSAVADDVRRQHARIVRYLNGHRFAHAVFNPFLSGAFRLLVESQWAEFERLDGRPPDFVNGHHHMHLSANVLGQQLLPARSRLRGPFTFKAGEKGRVNRWYRGRLARRLRESYITPDCLYSIEPLSDFERLRRITQESIDRNVELEVHPEDSAQHQLLRSRDFHQLLKGVDLQGFRCLDPESGRC